MKNTKKIAALLAAQMLVSALPGIASVQADGSWSNVAYAETSGIEGTLKPGYTLTAPAGGAYQWYRCDSAEAEGTAIEGATVQSYTLVNADGEKYLKVSVDGTVYTTEKISAPLNHGWSSSNLLNVYGMPEAAPVENVFVIKGDATNQKFVLLDEADESGAAFFVVTEDNVYGGPIYGGTQKWSNHMGAGGELPSVLVNGYYRGEDVFSNGKILPQNMAAYIDADHVWLTEGGMAGQACPDDYTFTAPITILSLSELLTYRTKMKYSDYLWTRTPSPEYYNAYLGIWHSGLINHTQNIDGWYVRPCFWLGEDVFKNVALDLDATGDNVKDILRTRYTKNELKAAGYTNQELITLFDDVARITGTLKPGYTLTAPAGGAYQWYRCDSADAEGTAIEGATAQSYTLVNADGEKYLKVSVDGTVYTTEKIAAPLNHGWTPSNLITVNMPESAPAENIFVIESDTTLQKFVLLDEADEKDASFFTVTEDSVHAGPVYGGTQKWSNHMGSEIPGVLANGYYKGEDVFGNGKVLPQNMAAYIDADHVWLTEGGAADGACPDDYLFTAPVTILSLSELLKYQGKIKYSHYLWTRTPSPDANVHYLGISTWAINQTGWNDGWAYRPCFWLGEDVFKNVRLDLLNTGDNVKKMLRERYTRAELSAIYDAEELASIGYDTMGSTVYNFKYRDVDGAVIDEIKYAGGALNITASLVNYSADSSASVITAIYDAKGDMVKVALKNYTLTKGVETPVEIAVDLSGIDESKGYSASTYFWNSIEGMVPLCEGYVF